MKRRSLFCMCLGFFVGLGYTGAQASADTLVAAEQKSADASGAPVKTSDGAIEPALSSAVSPSEKKVSDDMPKLPPMPVFKTVVIPPYKGPLANVTPERAVEFLLPLMIAQDVDNMVKLMKGVSAPQARAILTLLFAKEDSNLTVDDKSRLLVGLVSTYYATDELAQRSLFDLLLRYALVPNKPLAFIAARASYVQAIPAVLSWAENRTKKDKKAPAWLKESGFKALQAAVMSNDFKSFSTVLNKGVYITPVQAGQLLFEAAGVKKERIDFVAPLVRLKADLNYVGRGHTPLMKATAAGNLAFVKALVQAGADINFFVDTALGTALQIAIEQKQLAIEEFLRRHGAQE